MNFYDFVLRDKPRAAYKFNGTTWADISGNGYAFNSAGPTKGKSIVTGNTSSFIASNSSSFSMSTGNVWRVGKETLPFTIEVISRPITVTGDISVLSHYQTTPPDGIHFDANKLYFDVLFNAGRVSASWEYPDFTEAYVIHGVYTPSKIQLMVNGSVVSEASIPDGYVASGFNHAFDGDAYFGLSATSTDRLIGDGVAFYPYTLSETQIAQHVSAARDAILMDDNVAIYNGSYRDGTNRNIFQQAVFKDADSWTSDSMTNVTVTDGTLRPNDSYDTATLGQSLPGVWIGSFDINNAGIEALTLAGIKIEWNGDGNFTVQTSLDGGSTYAAATNGNLIATSQGINPSGKVLLVKVTFTGGVVDDQSVVRDMTLTAYADNVIYGADNSRTMTITGNVSTSLVRNEPIESNTFPGIRTYGGTMVMSADATGSPQNIQAIEVWVNPKGVISGAGGYIFDTRPYGGTAYMWIPEATGFWQFTGASAVYINGVAATSGSVTAMKNEWTHILFVFATPFNTAINFFGATPIADYNLIATYPSTFTAAQALALYNGYSQKPVTSIVDPSTTTIFEPASPYVLTVRDWTNLPQQ